MMTAIRVGTAGEEPSQGEGSGVRVKFRGGGLRFSCGGAVKGLRLMSGRGGRDAEVDEWSWWSSDLG